MEIYHYHCLSDIFAYIENIEQMRPEKTPTSATPLEDEVRFT